MKKVIFLLTILFINQFCFGQKEVLPDSVLEKKIDSLNIVVKKLWSKNLDSAQIVTKYMFVFSEKHNYLRGKAKAYVSSAIINDYRGFQDESMMNYIKAAKIFEQIDDQLELAILNYNIGVSLVDLKEFEEARLYVEKAHKYYLKNNIKKQLTYSYSTLAYIDIQMDKNLSEIILKLKEAEKIAIETKDTLMLCTALYQQGGAYIKYNKNMNLAISQLEKALKLVKIKDPRNHFYLGTCYNFLADGLRKKKDYKKALLYNDSSLVHYKSLKFIQIISSTYEKRKQIFASLGRYKESNEAFELYSKYKDSAFQIDKINELSRIKTEYETEQIKGEKETAEAKVILTEAVSKQNKNYFIGSTIIGILILLTSVFYFSRLKARKKMELIALELDETQKRLTVEKDLRASELKALKSQMNPHFIFNALNSIQDYIITNEKKLAREYLVKFSRLIRIYLEQTQLSEVFLTDEVKALELYLQLEKARFDDNFNYTIYVDESLDKDRISVPSLFIQPYVENALKHGLMHKKEDKLLNIKFDKLDETTMLCTITDNGIGREDSAKINKKRKYMHKSFATSANEKRVTLINKTKPESKISVEIIDLYDVEKQSLGTGTKVALKIPI